jgi:hypothetical protein
MLVQSHRVRSATLATADLAAEPKVAVLLNGNAKRVTDKVAHRVSHVVPEEDLYLSHDMDDCRRIAKKVVEKQYHTVFTGGGDGTFMAFVNAIHEEMATQGVNRAPRFGVLKLGTGNALATLVGASPLDGDGILDDILRARANEVPSVRRLELLECEGKLAPFAGLGYDSAILNDYVSLTKAAGPAKNLLSGVPGYFLSVTCKTLPYYLTHTKPIQVEVVCEGRGVKVDSEGKTTQVYQQGDVLYRGPVNTLCAGTVPCYGFQFRMFPFAGQRRGMMHLRASNAPALACATHVTRLWQGKWFHPAINDFLVDAASVRFERPMPLQVGGDAEGKRETLSLRMTDWSVDLVDFTATLN